MGLKDKLTLALHKPYDLSIPTNRALERERRIALTSITAILYKIIVSATPLITLKITYDYLGVEVYGLWSAVTNFFAIFAFSDLGIGNGLQTKLSKASGLDDTVQCRSLVASTHLILWVVSAILFLIFAIAYPIVDWASLMNAIDRETIELAAPIVFVIVLPKIFSIPVAIINRTQLALQEGYNSNIWGIAGAILSLIYIVLCSYLDLGKVFMLCGSSIIPLVVSALNMFVYYGFQRKDLKLSIKYANWKTSKGLMSLGVYFFLLSILTTVGLSMDTFIVAKACTLAEAASFSILYKLALIISSVLTIFCQPLWGANGEAIARGDIEWVKRNTRKVSLALTGVTTICSIIFVFSAPFVFRIWLGENFLYSSSCLIWLCIMQIEQAFISPYFMFLNASGIVKFQLLLFAIFTPVSFILKYFLASTYGIFAVPCVGAVLYMLIILLGSYFISIKKISKLQRND